MSRSSTFLDSHHLAEEYVEVLVLFLRCLCEDANNGRGKWLRAARRYDVIDAREYHSVLRRLGLLLALGGEP